MNRAVIRQTIWQTLHQPAMLFLLIIQIGFLVLLIAVLQLEYDQGTLISMKFFSGKIDESEAHFFLREILPNTAFFLATVIMFLLIVGTSSVFPDLLQDPLLGIILAKPVMRSALLISKLFGVNLAVLLNLLTFAASLTFILFLKTEGVLLAAPLIIALWLFLQFSVLSAFGLLVAMLVENSMSVTVLTLAVYFLLRPLAIDVDESNLVIWLLTLPFPPFRPMDNITREALFHNTNTFPISFPLYFVIYLSTAVVLFNRKDLR